MTSRPFQQQRQAETGHAMHLTDYLRVLYKRRWTAGLAFLLVFVLGAVDTLKKTSIYEADTQLLIEREARRATTLNSVLDDQSSWYDDDFYQTEYQILKSRNIAWQALKALGKGHEVTTPADAVAPATATSPAPVETGLVSSVVGWVSHVIGAPKTIPPPPADETTAQSEQISAFLGGLQVTPVRGTHLVTVSYRSPDPVMAERAANEVAKAYIAQTQDLRTQASVATTDWLKTQLDDARKKLEQSDEALTEYKQTHDAVALDDRQNTVVAKLNDLSAAATRAQQERIAKEQQYRTLQSLEADPTKLESFPLILGNENIQALKAELRDAQTKLDQLSANYGPKYPLIKDQQLQVQTLQGKLNTEIQNVVESVHTEFLTAQQTEQQLEAAYNQQKQQALNLDRKGVEYAALQREAASNKALYDNLLARVNEGGVTSEYKGSNIQVIDAAEVPRAPVLPNHKRDLLVALLGGCLLAGGLVFGLEYLDSRIKTPDELKAHLGLPFLGLVPTVSGKTRDGESLLLTHNNVSPAFAEAMRAIRTSVIFSSADEGARTVVVTSTAPSEGKTLISSNLAVALAQAGQRTLIIDGDLRRPRVHDVFDRSQEPGLSNVLVGTSRLRDAVRTTEIPNLHLLAAGHLPPNPAELLGSTRYLDLVDELRHLFDWILIDAPPVIAVTDAAVVAHSATGVVFVVGADMTSRRNAMSAIEHLNAARAKFIGAVLNRVNVERHSYYYAPYYRRDYTRAYERSTK
jgi:polysaccharide biosynthesis transport protein